MKKRNGFSFVSLLIAVVLIGLLMAGKMGYLDQWLGKFKKTESGKAVDLLTGGYTQTQIATGEKAKSQISDIQKTLNDKYKDLR